MEMVPVMKNYQEKAQNTFKSLLKKLIEEKYAEFEF
jgi:hypothetical protein